MPWDPSHTIQPSWHFMGLLDTTTEQDEAKALLAEYDTYGDMVIVPARDAYTEQTPKMLCVLQTFCQQFRAPYLVKQDDEFGMRFEQVQALIAEHEKSYPGQELYAGTLSFIGTEYDVMRGPDGTIAPFFGGPFFLVSRRLACLIGQEDYAHSALKSFYGTSSDDANVGKWVDYASRKHGLQVHRVRAQMTFELDAVERLPADNTTVPGTGPS